MGYIEVKKPNKRGRKREERKRKFQRDTEKVPGLPCLKYYAIVKYNSDRKVY